MGPHDIPLAGLTVIAIPVLAVSFRIVVRAIADAVAQVRAASRPQPVAPDPQVARLQAEVDELRAQVERLSTAESFYAQLQAGPDRG
ncbi:MAG TPA: hypothetical protein VF746_25500 [Longimicrobium sp.]